MKTTSYNPSTIEMEFANAVKDLQQTLSSRFTNNKILKIELNTEDNPRLVLYLEDEDGDKHELVVKVIQRVDK